jgi:hypothetical protein
MIAGIKQEPALILHSENGNVPFRVTTNQLIYYTAKYLLALPLQAVSLEIICDIKMLFFLIWHGTWVLTI